MAVIDILIVLIIVGFIMWLANTFIPMDEETKKILYSGVVVFFIFWMLKTLWLISTTTSFRL